MFRRTRYLLAAVLFFNLSPAQAVSTFYSSQSSFLTALDPSASIVTHNFDGLAAGSLIASGDTINGATFNYMIDGGYSIEVDDTFDATSPNNYLGTNDGSHTFLGGDGFTITFDQTLQAIGLYILSSSTIFANDFTLTTNAGHTINNTATADITLSDGLAYYIGLVEDDTGLGFNSITFSSADFGFTFNIDDITSASAGEVVATTPLPAAAWLMGTGLLILAGIGRRKGKLS